MSSSSTVEKRERPLVSFVVFAYQQESYIQEALRGALSQDYEPLEVIVSDDCSRDRTFELIQAEVQAYRGAHRVIVNRNEANLGMGRHVNKCMELARGDLVVASAGDDVSLPGRTSALVAAWQAAGQPAASLHSSYIVIDEHGKEYGVQRGATAQASGGLLDLCQNGLSGVIGATHAWHRRVFDVFGPLDEKVGYEDQVIPVRSRLIGDVIFVDQPLVQYRRAAGAVTFPERDLSIPERRQRKWRYHDQLVQVYRQWRRDFARVEDPPKGWRRMVDAMEARARFERAMQERGFLHRVSALARVVRYPENWKRALMVYPWHMFWFLGDLRARSAWFGKGWHSVLNRRTGAK